MVVHGGRSSLRRINKYFAVFDLLEHPPEQPNRIVSKLISAILIYIYSVESGKSVKRSQAIPDEHQLSDHSMYAMVLTSHAYGELGRVFDHSNTFMHQVYAFVERIQETSLTPI
jgi:hypothetical protein